MIHAIKNTHVSNEIFFPVQSKPALVERNDGTIVNTNFQAIFRPDTNQTLSIQSKKYALVPNISVYPRFEEALVSSGLDLSGMTVRHSLTHGGGRTYVYYDLPAHSVEVALNDTVGLQLRVCNSYNGSMGFMVQFGALRLACLNGMVVADKINEQYSKHTSGFSVSQMVKQVERIAAVYEETTEMWKGWVGSEITEQQASEVLSKMKGITPLVHKQIMEQFIVEKEGLGSTKWALFNALTHWSTHSEIKRTTEENAAAVIDSREKKVISLIRKIDTMKVAA